jgi:putative heme-binding domain-containing protein
MKPRVLPRRVVVIILILVAAGTLPAFGQGAGDALMRLLKGGKLPPERLPSVIEMVSRRGDAADLGYLFEQVTKEGGWTGEPASAALRGLADAAANRKVKPAGDLKRLEALFSPEQTAEVRAQAIRLAGLWQVEGLQEPLKAVALAESASRETRASALTALASYGDAGRKTIESLAAAAGSVATRAAAIEALASLDLAAAAKHAAAALAAAKPDDDVAPLLAPFLVRQGGPEALAAALGSVKLPPEAARSALRSMYSVGRSDGSLSAALGQAAGIAMEDKPFTPDEIRALAAAVPAEGDPQRGEMVFRRGDLSCLKCHAVSGAGGNIGPDLSAIGPSNPIDYLVTSILEPDAAVKEHYVTQVVVTSDGLVVTGIVADENEERLVLRTAEGQERSIPSADIEERGKGNSLMPKGLVKFMTRQEFVDLVRFLAELGKPGTPYALRSTPTVQRWRLLRDLPREFADGIPAESSFRELLPEIGSSGWQPVYARLDGALPLDEVSAGSDRPLYLLAELDVRKAGGVGLRFDEVAGLDLWVNGDHIDTLSKNFATEFPEGRQSFVLRVDPAKRPVRTLRVELFKPDGSQGIAEPVGGP